MIPGRKISVIFFFFSFSLLGAGLLPLEDWDFPNGLFMEFV